MSKSYIPHNIKEIQKEGEKKFQLKYLFEEIHCQDIQPFMLYYLLMPPSVIGTSNNFIKLILTDQEKGLSYSLCFLKNGVSHIFFKFSINGFECRPWIKPLLV